MGVVDHAQATFIPGSSIVDNIHLAQELLRKYARKHGSPRCMLKVDIQKAYDTVDWDFIREVLTYLNFLSIFISWIMECVTTTSYLISVNGHMHGNFEGRRGLRQDALLLFCRGDVNSVSMIMDFLYSFGYMAGLRVRLQKSNIYMACVDDYVRNGILDVTGFSDGMLPFRYLGIPIASANLRTSDYSLLVDVVKLKLSS